MPELPISPAGRRYGAKPTADPRDYTFKVSAPVALPAMVDLEDFCGPKKDQGDLGACTAFAGTGNTEYLFRRFKVGSSTVVLSPLELYYLERQLDGTLAEGDCGSEGRTACKVMNQFGVCTESDDPYMTRDYTNAPTSVQLADGLLNKAGAYHSLHSVNEMKLCIASFYPMLIGFEVYESFESKETASTGLMPIAGSGELLLGGHEVLAIGYDDNKAGPGWVGAFKIRNSWGAFWGDRGNFWMSYKTANSTQLLDAWIQHLGKAWK